MVAVLRIEPVKADGEAWESALRPKRCLLSIHVKLRNIVASKLILDWSPEQISGWLKIQYPDDESMRVSHETIYRSLFIQARGVLKRSCWGTCDPSAAYAGRSTLVSLKTRAVKSPRPSPSGKDPLRWRTAPFLVIGGRSPARLKEQSHRDLGGTPFAFHRARKSLQQRHGGCHRRTDSACS